MKTPDSGLRADNPALPALKAIVSYQDVTTAAGNAAGTTLVCTGLASEPSYQNHLVKVMSGDAAGQVRRILTHAAGSNTATVDVGFTDSAGAAVQIVADTVFAILSIGGGSGGGAGSIIASGLFTTSSATAPRDSARTEAINFFRGMTIMPTEGAMAFRPSLVVSYHFLGLREFVLDVNNAFPGACGLVHYVVLASQAIIGATTDSVQDNTYADVVGRKDDAAQYAVATTRSLMAYLKGQLGTRLIATGTFTTSSATAPVDNTRAEGADFFKGCMLMPIAGAVAFQPKPIGAFAAGGTFTPDEPFTAAPGLVAYVIIASDYPAQRLADIVAALAGEMLLIRAFNTTQTTQGASVVLFAISAVGGSKKDIKAGFYLAADGAATFTVSVWKTRAGALATLVQDLSKASAALPWTIVTPGAAGQYTYELGDLEEGLQMEFRIAQSAAGAANVLCDAALTYLD